MYFDRILGGMMMNRAVIQRLSSEIDFAKTGVASKKTSMER